MVNRQVFERMVSDAFNTLPDRIRQRVVNVVFIVEDEASNEVRVGEGLTENETLFGLYTGIPCTARGTAYGVGGTFPDMIYIYQNPIEEAAAGDILRMKDIVRDTVWHEVAHYFGYEEDAVMRREQEGTNYTN